MKRLIVAVLMLATPVFAADEAPILTGDIPPAEWRAMALGKTLTYMIGPNFFALERYSTTGNRVDLQLNNGECLVGTWSHSGNSYCFDWGDPTPACFRHVKTENGIKIIQMDNGVETQNIQHMVKISNAPLDCGMNMS